MTTRAELLQFEGTGRNILERRITLLVRVLDAATELVAADDHANETIMVPPGIAELTGDELTQARERWIRSVTDSDERCERAWEELQSVLKAV